MSATQMMTLDDFEANALAYGGDVARWPDGGRGAAELLEDSERAREMLREAQAFDATLDLWEAPAPSHGLMSRVLEDAAMVSTQTVAPAPRPAARKGWLARLADPSGWRLSGPKPAFALAACLAVGFSLGMTLDGSMLLPVDDPAEELVGTDLAFAIEDDSDLLLGPEFLL